MASSETRKVRNVNGYGSTTLGANVLNATHPANHTTWISRKDVLPAKAETRSLSRSSALRCALDFASRSAIFCTFRKTGDGVGAPRAETVPPPGSVCDDVDNVCGRFHRVCPPRDRVAPLEGREVALTKFYRV